MNNCHHDVIVIGAGFSGLGAAIKLTEAGVDDVVILERADEVGGTWRDNTYPGAACDIPSVMYSFSFAPNPRWSRVYSGGPEILGYLRHLADWFALRPRIRFGTTVTGLAFDEGAGTWEVSTDRETYTARAVVLAGGPLSTPGWPAIPGRETYEGHQIHSAAWDHDYDLTGKRVAVVGTGASAVQIIPELVDTVEHLTVFQRTPGWVIPRLDLPVPGPLRAVFGALPATQAGTRLVAYAIHETMSTGMVWSTPVTSAIETLARRHLHKQVPDPWLRRQLTPDFRAGCKRMLVSNDFYPALQRDNAKLVTWPIARMSPDGIRTADGIERRFDCVVFATGFDVSTTGTPIPVTGLGGRQLAHDWARGVSAYRSVSVSGYPNLVLTFGPNSGPGHNSALVYLEGQLAYLTRGIRRILDDDLAVLDVRPEVQERYNARIQHRLRRTTWNSGCSSWFLTADGYNGTMYPGTATQYLRQMATFPDRAYDAVAAG
jgi:cation diffusion facilitator CzcD-associated flavoprotein CzcO